MVFAVRCPSPKCRKYMLVEDSERGKIIPCLICKSPIQTPYASGPVLQDQPATPTVPAITRVMPATPLQKDDKP